MESIISQVRLSLGIPFIRISLICLGVLLALVPFIYETIRHFFKTSDSLMKELYLRYFTWIALAIVLILPLLSGRTATISVWFVLAFLCFSEYSKASGLSSNKLICLLISCGITGSFIAIFTQLFQTFTLLIILCLILVIFAVLQYRKSPGKLNTFQHAVIACCLFTISLAYFACFANFSEFSSIMLMTLICVEFNDVFAYICGKLFGKKKLCPKISPKKTIAGFAGALFISSVVFYVLGSFVFENSPLNTSVHLIVMGLLCSFLGQAGDLLLSWIKRDLGLKDFSRSLPGHGGFLDRFDSLVLVSPVLFHYIYFFDSSRLNQVFGFFSS